LGLTACSSIANTDAHPEPPAALADAKPNNPQLRLEQEMLDELAGMDCPSDLYVADLNQLFGSDALEVLKAKNFMEKGVDIYDKLVSKQKGDCPQQELTGVDPKTGHVPSRALSRLHAVLTHKVDGKERGYRMYSEIEFTAQGEVVVHKYANERAQLVKYGSNLQPVEIELAKKVGMEFGPDGIPTDTSVFAGKDGEARARRLLQQDSSKHPAGMSVYQIVKQTDTEWAGLEARYERGLLQYVKFMHGPRRREGSQLNSYQRDAGYIRYNDAGHAYENTYVPF
jgi:hypothetical protein